MKTMAWLLWFLALLLLISPCSASSSVLEQRGEPDCKTCWGPWRHSKSTTTTSSGTTYTTTTTTRDTTVYMPGPSPSSQTGTSEVASTSAVTQSQSSSSTSNGQSGGTSSQQSPTTSEASSSSSETSSSTSTDSFTSSATGGSPASTSQVGSSPTSTSQVGSSSKSVQSSSAAGISPSTSSAASTQTSSAQIGASSASTGSLSASTASSSALTGSQGTSTSAGQTTQQSPQSASSVQTVAATIPTTITASGTTVTTYIVTTVVVAAPSTSVATSSTPSSETVSSPGSASSSSIPSSSPASTSFTSTPSSVGGTASSSASSSAGSTFSSSSLPSVVPGIAAPTVPASATCEYGVQPWCLTSTAQGTATATNCLCPSCVAQPSYCSEVRPTDTGPCPDQWLCTVTTDSQGSAYHSVWPGYAPKTTGSTTWPWNSYESTITATDGSSTTTVPFTVSYGYHTSIRPDATPVVYPIYEWQCQGSYCYPPGYDFSCLLHFPPDCAGGVVGGFPLPFVPFPPPVGPPPPAPVTMTGTVPTSTPTSTGFSSSSSTSESCTQTSTYTDCDVYCLPTTVSATSTVSCSTTCYTTSGCTGTATTSTTTGVCSISPYWDDPAIIASVSSIMAQFPFTMSDIMEPTDTASVSSTSSSLSSMSTSSAPSSSIAPPSTSTTSSPVPPIATSTSSSQSIIGTLTITVSPTPKSSSSPPQTTSKPKSAPPPTTTTVIVTSTSTDWPARTNECRKFDWTKELYKAKGKNDHDAADRANHEQADHSERVLCMDYYAGKEQLGLIYFWWDDAIVDKACESMHSRNPMVEWRFDDDITHPQAAAECYRYAGPSGDYYTTSGDYEVLIQFAMDVNACRYWFTGECVSPQCARASWDRFHWNSGWTVDECKSSLRKVRDKCSDVEKDGKTFKSGGSYLGQCVRWTVVARQTWFNLPPSTDDQ